MKVLFLVTSVFNPLQFGVLLDEAEIMYREGHDVYFSYCAKTIQCCTNNMTGKKSNCDLCSWSSRHALKNLSKGIKRIKISDYVSNGSFETLRNNVTYLEDNGYAILIRTFDFNNNFYYN